MTCWGVESGCYAQHDPARPEWRVNDSHRITRAKRDQVPRAFERCFLFHCSIGLEFPLCQWLSTETVNQQRIQQWDSQETGTLTLDILKQQGQRGSD